MLSANPCSTGIRRRNAFSVLAGVMLILVACKSPPVDRDEDGPVGGQAGEGSNVEGGSGGRGEASALRTTAEPASNELFLEPVLVTLKANRPATTHFTIDGTDPDENSPTFREPIALGETTVLKFFSEDEAGAREEIVTATYKIDHVRHWLLSNGAQ